MRTFNSSQYCFSTRSYDSAFFTTTCSHGISPTSSMRRSIEFDTQGTNLWVACSLIGSLGVSYTGALVANLAIALFALVAIESGSQALGRTYAVLLVCALLLDIAWFILFLVEIRQYPLGTNIGKLTAFSLQLVLGMQIAGFTVRFVSAFLWLQMYRLGSDQGGIYSHIDVEARVGSLRISSPGSSPRTTPQSSISDEVLGGSIYNPAYYSSLFSSSDEGHSFKEVDGLYKINHSHGSDPRQHVNKLPIFNHEPA